MKLMEWLKRRGASSEDSYPYDGFLSYSAEWHALSFGFYDGLTDIRPNGLSQKSLANSDVQKETAYARGGYVIGYVSRPLLIVILAKVGGYL